MYLQALDIRYCRCSFLDQCTYKALIFIVADALFGINVSATCFSSNLQILLSLPVMYNCIYILPFLGFKDTPFTNFASTSHVFDNVKMLSIKILHLQCSKIHYRRYCRSISFKLLFTSQLEPIHYLQKINIRNSCEYGVSVEDT